MSINGKTEIPQLP